MPSWHDLLNEIKEKGSTYDVVRREYLAALYKLTGRNVIVYYSGWLQKPSIPSGVNDSDKNGFMTVVHKLDKQKGLDLILHTPGGETAATESLVDYLRSMFGTDIRAVIPQIAMSAGTTIACACKEIIMGKHSSLGPIDPIFLGMPAHGVVEEFNRAHQEIKEDQTRGFVWSPIIQQYSPTMIGECEKAIQWSNEMTREWLLSGMLKDVENAETQADAIIGELADHALTKSHDRHLGPERCRNIGLKVTTLEEDQDLQEAVLSVHHACIHTLSATGAYKIIENHDGIATMSVVQPLPGNMPS